MRMMKGIERITSIARSKKVKIARFSRIPPLLVTTRRTPIVIPKTQAIVPETAIIVAVCSMLFKSSPLKRSKFGSSSLTNVFIRESP